MESGDRILVAAGLTAAVVVGAFVLWGPGGAPRVRKRRGQIAGLQNLGRTCFLNTLLQALAACPAFIEWLKRYAKSEGNNSMITTLYTVIEVVNGTHESARGTPVCPLGVLQALRAAGWVVPADQQDAHELLHVLLSCIEEETAAMAKRPGCLSDALGLHGWGRWSALASPASSPATPGGGRPPQRPASATSPASPPTTPGGPRPLQRPASAAPPHEPGLVNTEAPEPVPLGLQKGVSRSFCQLSCLGRVRGGQGGQGGLRAPPPPPPFRGSLASRLQCTVCSHKSPVRYDKFDSISLSMANASTGLTGNYSLAGLLRAFTAPEMVKGVKCSKCVSGEGEGEGGHTPHIRTVSFGKLPACLCLHVGRVEWVGGGLAKRAEHVAFPESLAMAPYTAPNATKLELPALLSAAAGPGGVAGAGVGVGGECGGRAAYRLAAVVVHVGGARSGHFATYRRGNGFEARRWWYTSDTLVHEVSLQEVLRCTAYMLFYEKARETTALSAVPGNNHF